MFLQLRLQCFSYGITFSTYSSKTTTAVKITCSLASSAGHLLSAWLGNFAPCNQSVPSGNTSTLSSLDTKSGRIDLGMHRKPWIFMRQFFWASCTEIPVNCWPYTTCEHWTITEPDQKRLSRTSPPKVHSTVLLNLAANSTVITSSLACFVTPSYKKNVSAAIKNYLSFPFTTERPQQEAVPVFFKASLFKNLRYEKSLETFLNFLLSSINKIFFKLVNTPWGPAAPAWAPPTVVTRRIWFLYDGDFAERHSICLLVFSS